MQSALTPHDMQVAAEVAALRQGHQERHARFIRYKDLVSLLDDELTDA